jgi:anti-sigma factor RsiW
MRGHLDETEINDWVDGLLDPARQREIERHVLECDQCRHDADSLRSVLRSVHALPREVEPPASIRSAIRARIDEAPAQFDVFPGTVAVPRWYDRSLRSLRAPLAAAAAILIAFSAALTTLFIKDDATALPGTSLVDPQFASVEARYRQATEELAALLHDVRAALPDGTGSLLDHDLAVLDTALAEARNALALDPGNPMLTSILLASYEKKLEILRRAADAQTL